MCRIRMKWKHELYHGKTKKVKKINEEEFDEVLNLLYTPRPSYIPPLNYASPLPMITHPLSLKTNTSRKNNVLRKEKEPWKMKRW